MRELLRVFSAAITRFPRFLYVLIVADKAPLLPRVVVVLSVVVFVAYLNSPYQLIPESVPIFGYFDDVGILLLGLFVARRLTPHDLLVAYDAAAPRHGAGGSYGTTPDGLRFAVPGEVGDGPSTPSLYDLMGYRRAWLLQAVIAHPDRSSIDPIVVGGCGRSGTTLLRTILDRHQSICCGDESTVFLRRISAPRDIGIRYGTDAQRIVEMLRSSRSQVEFIEAFRAACLARSGKTVWAEKTPDNVLRFGFIRSHFPNARLVHIVRDGRDVVCSLRRKEWAKLRGCDPMSIEAIERCAAYWVRRVEAGRRFRDDPRYFELRYEQLVTDPEDTLRPLLSFLDIPWDATALGGGATGIEAIAIHETAAGRWRAELTTEELAAFDRVAGRTLRSLGYGD